MGRRLGQHFLRDGRVLEDVVAAARLAPGQRVLEVGPGPGNLTGRLAQAVSPGPVVAIEADAALARGLQGRWANVEVVHGDAARQDLARHGRFDRIVANLPYLISGPITIAFLELLRDPATRWGRAVLMYQREFADRLAAGVGDDAYGRLSVQAARWVRVEAVRDVAPGAFDPPPKVRSTVLALEPHLEAPFPVHSERMWEAVLDAWRQRRKKLRNSLPGAVAKAGVGAERAAAALESLGAAERRPEELSPAEFAALSERLAEA